MKSRHIGLAVSSLEITFQDYHMYSLRSNLHNLKRKIQLYSRALRLLPDMLQALRDVRASIHPRRLTHFGSGAELRVLKV